MSSPPGPQERMLGFASAAHVLIEAYGEVVVNGSMHDPELAEAALVQLKHLIVEMRVLGPDPKPYGGDAVNRLAELEHGFVHHSCSHSWCPAGLVHDYTAGHDWQTKPGDVLRCTQCTLAHSKWAGRGCPESAEVLGNSVYW